MDNYFFKENIVVQIYDFFKNNNFQSPNPVTIYNFLEGKEGFIIKDEKGLGRMDVGMVKYISKICSKMENDGLLMRIKVNTPDNISDSYMSVYECNFNSPDEFRRSLEEGDYDCKYKGFPYVRHLYMNSVLPIIGKNHKGDDDNGTCYYIGNNSFITAAHCINGLSEFRIENNDGHIYPIQDVCFREGADTGIFDLALIRCKEDIKLKPLMNAEPEVLDDVLVMGYPPIPGLFTTLTSETATINSIISSHQKATAGQVIASSVSYLDKMEYMLINARVKGGNSGGPVINSYGQVVGTVIQIPFDNIGGAEKGRYDIMGYGMCLPSKYTDDLCQNIEVHQVEVNDIGNCRMI